MVTIKSVKIFSLFLVIGCLSSNRLWCSDSEGAGSWCAKPHDTAIFDPLQGDYLSSGEDSESDDRVLVRRPNIHLQKAPFDLPVFSLEAEGSPEEQMWLGQEVPGPNLEVKRQFRGLIWWHTKQMVKEESKEQEALTSGGMSGLLDHLRDQDEQKKLRVPSCAVKPLAVMIQQLANPTSAEKLDAFRSYAESVRLSDESIGQVVRSFERAQRRALSKQTPSERLKAQVRGAAVLEGLSPEELAAHMNGGVCRPTRVSRARAAQFAAQEPTDE